MFENPLIYWACFLLLPMLLAGLLGALIAWFLRPKPVAGDLNVEGEARLRQEADELRAKLRAVEADANARSTEVSDLKGKLAAAAAGAAAAGAATAAVKSDDKDDDEAYALEWRNRYLAARVKYLEGRLAEGGAAAAAGGAALAAGAAAKAKPKAKSTSKAKAAPKSTTKAKAKPKAKTGTTTATKAATTRKKPGPKPGTKRGATNKDGTPRKKPGPKPKAKKAVDPMDKYYENVRKYDGRASRDTVANVVKYCGVSLRNRDTALVACSDPKERERIVKGFAARKLGLKKDAAETLVADICQEMRAQRQKSRVTFYYLMAKKAGKLKEAFG